MAIPYAPIWAMVLAWGPVAHADVPAACGEDRLEQVMSTVADAPPEVRRRLLAEGVQAACGSALSEGQLVWLSHWSRGEHPSQPAEVEAVRSARDAFCPKGRKLRSPSVTPDWDDHLQVLWRRCRLEQQGWLDWDEFRRGEGPDAVALAGALYRSLKPYSERSSRAIARWMAGHPDDPRDALPSDTLGAFLPAAAGLELVQSTSLTSPYAGCVPVVTLGPDMLEVNGQPATGSTLADGVAACRDLTPRTDEDDFRGEVHLFVDGTTSYRRVVDTMASLWHQNYGNFGLVVAGGAAHTDSGSTLTEANEYTRMRRVDVMLPPDRSCCPTAAAPRWRWTTSWSAVAAAAERALSTGATHGRAPGRSHRRHRRPLRSRRPATSPAPRATVPADPCRSRTVDGVGRSRRREDPRGRRHHGTSCSSLGPRSALA